MDYLHYERKAGYTGNNIFSYRHVHFHPVIEEQILWDILNAIHQRRMIRLYYHSPKNQDKRINNRVLIPYKLRYDVRHGRFYLVSFTKRNKCFVSRLDRIENVELSNEIFDRNDFEVQYKDSMTYSWSSASMSCEKAPETVKLEIVVTEPAETYIIDRIRNEASNGFLEQIDKEHYHFTMQVNDSSEIIPWIRSYAGYVRVLESSELADKILNDWKEMLDNYGAV
jgi:predicted DNA-binding transcriptional regulator YafY